MSRRTCERRPEPAIADRAPILVERDDRLFSYHVERLAHGTSRREHAPAPLVHDDLLEVLGGTDNARRSSAAFVAGRCSTGSAEDDAATAAALRALVESFDPARLRAAASVYVEGVFSMALLGDVDDATQRLTALVTVPEYDSIAGYLAAYYLAQLGSPAGYPILHHDLHDKEDAHARMMATRHVAAFLPYDGQRVDELIVDVRGELVARLRDRDDDVAQEVPELLLETGLPGIERDLDDATKRPFSKSVREAARSVLDSLARGR